MTSHTTVCLLVAKRKSKKFRHFIRDLVEETHNLLTPWCRVRLEKLTSLQVVKKFPAFYGTRRFVTALTSVRHMSLSWANPIQSTYPHPTSWRSILILSTHLRLGLPSSSFPPVSPPRPSSPPLLQKESDLINYLFIYLGGCTTFLHLPAPI